MKTFKLTKQVLGFALVIVMLFALATPAFAYSNQCTVGPIYPGTSAPGHITLNPYVGFGKTLYAEIVGGLDNVDYNGKVKVVVTRESNAKSYEITLIRVAPAYSLPVSFAGSGDYRVTVVNDTSASVSVLVEWR